MAQHIDPDPDKARISFFEWLAVQTVNAVAGEDPIQYMECKRALRSQLDLYNSAARARYWAAYEAAYEAASLQRR